MAVPVGQHGHTQKPIELSGHVPKGREEPSVPIGK